MFERWNQCFPLSQHCGQCIINKDHLREQWPGTSTVGLKVKRPGQLLITWPLAKKMKRANDFMLTVGDFNETDLMNSCGIFLFLSRGGLHPKRLIPAVRQAAVLHWRPWFGRLRLDVCSLQIADAFRMPSWLALGDSNSACWQAWLTTTCRNAWCPHASNTRTCAKNRQKLRNGRGQEWRPAVFLRRPTEAPRRRLFPPAFSSCSRHFWPLFPASPVFPFSSPFFCYPSTLPPTLPTLKLVVTQSSAGAASGRCVVFLKSFFSKGWVTIPPLTLEKTAMKFSVETK